MTMSMKAEDLQRIAAGYHERPERSCSLQAEAYTDPRWLAYERQAIFSTNWQWVCHVEKLREPGAYVTTEVAGQPICIVRDKSGALRAFYNVCKHRAHELLRGEGRTNVILCPYHAWSYSLEGQLVRAPETEHLQDFNRGNICLDSIRVEVFCGRQS